MVEKMFPEPDKGCCLAVGLAVSSQMLIHRMLRGFCNRGALYCIRSQDKSKDNIAGVTVEASAWLGFERETEEEGERESDPPFSTGCLRAPWGCITAATDRREGERIISSVDFDLISFDL